MIEGEVIVTTKHGRMPTFMAAPDGDEQRPGIIFYMDAPGIRDELRNMARRIAKHGYVCLLPDMYYRLGTVRLDMPRRDDGMSGVIRAAMKPISNAGKGLTNPEAGVMATNPATAPEIPPSRLGLPFRSHSTKIQPNTAAAVAKWVATKALVASADAATALPALNPNQPTHKRQAPMALITRLCGFIGST